MYADIGRSLSTDHFPIAACRDRWFLGPGAIRRAQPPRGTEDPRQHPPFPPGRLDPLADRHPPSLPAAFRKLDAVAVLTARLLPAPQPQSVMIGQARRPGADTAVAFVPETTGHTDRSFCAPLYSSSSSSGH